MSTHKTNLAQSKGHRQLHVGELCERLGSAANIDIEWVGLPARTEP